MKCECGCEVVELKERIKELESQTLAYKTINEVTIEYMQKREAKLVECVKYYADKNNWREHDPSNRPGGMTYSYRITTRDGSDVGPEKYTFSGGKRAREVLREMGVNKE